MPKPWKADTVHYEGFRGSGLAKEMAVVQRNDGSDLDPGPSLKLRNHSPDGFEWGYGGSGPAQLALAILLDFTGDEALAQTFYQRFKFDRIATAPKAGFKVTGLQIRTWLEAAARAGA
jgi:hypothetical protein